MGADPKHLPWTLARLTRDAWTRGLLGRAADWTLPPSVRSWLVARLARTAGEPAQLRAARRVPQLRLQAGCDAAEHGDAPAQPLCMYNVDQMTSAAGAAGRRRPRRSVSDGHTAQTRRRRWAAWQPAASWDFPTLNASFPFTIPAIPAGIFLIAQPGGHSSVPSGVIMPAGLGTAARKFHSMSLTRQPGVPYDGDEDNGSTLTDTDALSSQLLRADPAARAMAALRDRKPAAAGRRSDSGPPASRPRTTKNYMFAHAAAGIPKADNRIPLPRRAGTAPASASTAGGQDAEEMAASAGEDAFFHRADAIGIADGVGGWAGVKDADPSLFSRRLMHHVCREVQRYEDIDDELFSHYFDATPVDIMRRAYEITIDEMKAASKRGSSTACVVVLRGDELRVANLGDCGLTVVRQGDMVYRTEEQQHSFNYPYQLGTEPHSDKPSDAQVFRLKIQKGDVIIVGSDGVFDNLFDEDILEEVSLHLPPAMRAAGEPELRYSTDSLWYEPPPPPPPPRPEAAAPSEAPPAADGARPGLALPQFHIDPRAISRAIAQRAKLVSEDARYTESPFQLRAMQEGLYYQGGKRDDIAVVVAVVTDLEDTPDRR